MTIITDGKRTVEIQMLEWSDHLCRYITDWSDDFLEDFGIEYDEENDAIVVEDVDYCIAQAREEWEAVNENYFLIIREI